MIASFELRKRIDLCLNMEREREMPLLTPGVIQTSVQQAIERDPNLSRPGAEIIALCWNARVVGTDGGESFETLSEYLLRNQANSRNLHSRINELTERVEKLEAAMESMDSRRERLKLPRR